MKYFNTAGPCLADRHYLLPPQPRLPRARTLIDQGRFFVVRAPRQTGKTTTLAALADQLTREGRHLAVRFSCEGARAAGDDYAAAERMVLQAIREGVIAGNVPADQMPPDPWPETSPGSMLRSGLTAWDRRCPLPLVLFFDEIDALQGNSLISVLSQLRDGYTTRPAPFPHSVVLCGLRDVRDYKAAPGGDPERLGTSSPFNITAASLRLDDFTIDEVTELYEQHTAATGQKFTPSATQRAFEASQGQPWLVNALAYETTRMIPSPAPITDAHMAEAVERLIVTRATHLDSLVARLHEPRVQRLIEPLIAGELPDLDATYHEDLSYVRDLGLISRAQPVQVANPIYQEVILRVLAGDTESVVTAEPRSFVTGEGRLDFGRLLDEFVVFWKLHGEILSSRETYHEAACQLVFLGFLHRVVNGGGCIDREYGVGRGRIDVVVRWPCTDANGEPTSQWEAVELKVRHPGRADPLPDGLAQLDGYLDRLGLDTGTLVIFDRRPDAPPLPDRTALGTARTPTGRRVTLLRA
ncbi:hypothetical protein [Actinoallomurus sp. CA-150999]|uniref:ATP-binding protein n=1 Tax=Actinoallomurus sp. CA-150999 TaxID=3239887 RepID=UPI003D945CA3